MSQCTVSVYKCCHEITCLLEKKGKEMTTQECCGSLVFTNHRLKGIESLTFLWYIGTQQTDVKPNYRWCRTRQQDPDMDLITEYITKDFFFL